MQLVHQSHAPVYTGTEKKSFSLSSFFSWCKAQEQYRFGWLAAIITLHGCFITPLAFLLVLLTGQSLIFGFVLLGAMAVSLATNLAAMPTKITIPVFFFSILIHLAVVFSCVILSLQ